MKNLLTWKYWFSVNPEPLTSAGYYALYAALAVLLLAAIACYLAKRKSGLYRGAWKRFYGLAASNLVIGLLILFFNYENVPFFSARFWIGFWALETLIWLFFIAKSLKEIPKKKKELEAEKELKKYLP